MQRFFFAESRSFGYRATQLFDFIHPASVSLWNLRWQVQGFVTAVPDATEDELSGRFANGSGIQSTNLRRVCIDTSWEDQLGQFSQIMGASMIALYEGWAESLLPKLGHAKFAKEVQIPSAGTYGQNANTKGVAQALAEIHAAGMSPEMEKGFSPTYKSHSKYSFTQLDALVTPYRYHKEIRNSFTHQGGTAGDRAVNAWRKASALTAKDIGGKTGPILTMPVKDKPITYPIKEAIQLADVITRLVHTIDAELTGTLFAEQYFYEAWKGNPNIANLQLQAFPSDPVHQNRKINQICRKAGFLSPADPTAIIAMCKKSGKLS
ncbi:hypothetical protein [Kitasatospora herbaricolor]|uniref:Uncharacterized protein n=1 Tax=Kitasatospora herbaricolor TaxID=68217 RepID=A0ABZ1W0J2_9ACTN|nr:hypothetical protein [Kitasatospora herbaricolor]